MRITTKAVYDIESGKLLDWEGYEYSGPLEMCGGGPSSEQNAAAKSQANLTNQLAGVAAQNENYTEAQRNRTTPFYNNQMNNGPDYTPAALDFASGTNAKAFAPARADLMRRLGMQTGLPGGYRDQATTDFDSARARGFDQGIAQVLADRQAARERGAAGLMGEAQQANPLGYYQGAMQGNSSIMSANLRRPGIAGVLGGLTSSGLNAATAFA